MFDLFLEAYVRFFTSFLPALAIGALVVSATAAKVPSSEVGKAVFMTAGFLGIWHALAAFATAEGLVMPPATMMGPPYVLMLMFGGAFGVWALARLTSLGRAITEHTDQSILMAYQLPRVMGGVFLIGWANGTIPWQFALPAGIGDIWAGVAAWKAMRATQRGDSNARILVWRANIIGLVDFAVAIVTGLITSVGFMHLLSHDAPNIINAWPLGLFPSFFVGTFMAAHALSIGQLRRTNRRATLAV